MTKRIIVGLTGASGSIYTLALIKALASLEWQIELVMTPTGEKVLAFETGAERKSFPENVNIHENTNLFSSLASGSYRTSGMVVIPCSMNTLGLMATGTGDHLLARAAQVTLKERRPLVVVPREMPYNIIHLENMLRLARAGATIMPASPGFYHHPQQIQDLVNHVVGRVLDQFGIEHALFERWSGV
ncbi:polyprenyl p-hydroxybenzoate/phenylacrylic acid decarboxylase [Desulfosporosinus acidiphilus SJ4]|uniref:Flavin prenyltransferase UbiX n=1 Tax=Desulfosporosinus acidiphilus (strain DSM 22704 / JCM 16185 / SJ4) TaxID=646529 RepID=I4D5D8_DESAJ|nr:UbiX family flavin prenyltransferase [Desulfosporosinus acidiphilus]AFM41012.1 polyprenyl p-hydroxybenzoate/phenylacrylic acid decarboxylase [Desulfosporosinus acidiphilus SJ4]